MEYFFDNIQKFPGVGGWYFVRVPKKYYAQFKSIKKKVGYGFISIRAIVGGTTWNTSLLPGKGMYFIALKASVRKKEKINEGDRVKVLFEIL